ncbi:DUF86 domain-containing protein [Thermoflexus sp.]|uniref:DUF86 domain-containing protein n=1 Tax=Thermoflexus sp. TaxID=1969742 RepID=UPI0025F4F1C5|nr:DUF86 domain-containing protein [Thermoflexus sp.]MDW8181430.1 DUF86 domain-containing protein [Anaerolineae bacterium]MCS6962850.1 DUF86 domain-containing protein [Thermoflexus sp.]MCS7351971.1 DUF86 domain-containing protein [Thermoflexus sp.]MCX7690866.1 DUF86 domain-containing protein [Thermoflexus sp.]MDW8185259.1 DUF86 domain-containing protein [Anaerolineae bacterium]
MKPDPERVARLSAEILERLEKLRAYTAVDFTDFQADERTVLAAKMLLVEAVEGAAALCNHIMARRFRQAPGGFILCFDALGDRLGWEEEFRGRLRRLARFRNELIHEYREITPEQVYRMAREEAGALAEMVRRLREWLRAEGEA